MSIFNCTNINLKTLNLEGNFISFKFIGLTKLKVLLAKCQQMKL